MSWTSEHEPPSPRPDLETDDPPDVGLEVVDPALDGGAGDGTGSGPVDIPDEGPLDPSVFDGLFADLVDEQAEPDPVIGPAPGPAGPAGEIVAWADAVAGPWPLDHAPGDDAPPVPVNGHRDQARWEPVPEPPEDGGEPAVVSDLSDLVGSTTMPGIETEVEPETSQRSGADEAGSDPAGLLDHGPAGRTNDIYHGPEAYRPAPLDDHPPPPSAPVFQPDPEPQPAAVPPVRTVDPAAEAERVPVLRPFDGAPGPDARSRWPAFAMATVVGALLGVGGAVVLARLIGGGDRAADPASPTTELGAVVAPAEGDGADPSGPVVVAGGATELGPIDRLELGTLRFEPGTGNLTADSKGALELLRQALDQKPSQPIAVTVRTYTEATSADDLALSRRQAEALAERLVELGADPSQLEVTGLGRSLLTSAQPVPNFVVASAGLELSNLRTALQAISPFAIGLDSVDARLLRPESWEPLARIAQAMAADPTGGSVTLTAYSFGEPDAEANRLAAQAAAEAAATHLTSTYGIDASRLEINVVGEAPFAVTAAVGNHIGLRWGDLAAGSVALGAVPIDEIDFAPGSSALSESGAGILDQLLEAMDGTDLAVVIDVHSFDGADSQADFELSQDRASAIGEYLTGAGLPPGRLRVYGRGDRPQFRSERDGARMVVSLVPLAG
jgi:outer membrane protein OmpA-like peptidoglycan-associated protein